MKRMIFLSLALFAGVVFAVPPEFSFDAESNFFTFPGYGKVRFTMGDGARSPVALGTPVRPSADVIEYRRDAFDWIIRIEKRKDTIVFNSSVVNKTGGDLKLEPGMAFVGSRKAVSFWSGFGVTDKIEGKKLTRSGIKGPMEKHVGASGMPFPVSGAIDKDEIFYLGSIPFDPVSYTAGTFDPAKNEMTYSIRIVAAPGSKVPVRFTAGRAPVRYGAPEAVVQQYYENFPECWTIAGGQDNPYIWGNHGQYLNWWGKPDMETSRRYGVTLEWSYCPYRRSGDMIADEKLWNYKPYNQFRANAPQCGTPINMGSITRDEYLKHRKNLFHTFGRRFGIMFYNTVAGVWCEKNLAETVYPDSINHDKSVMYILNVWSTHHDQEIRVFPMGTTFAKVFERDMAALVKELALPGFALDCSYGGAYYRGPAVKKDLPGRAWDDEGVFIDQSVAINHEVDFIRSLRTNWGTEPTTFINGYLKGDYVMVEAPFFDIGKHRRWMPLLRWYIGPRPGCVHGHGYKFKDVVPDWRAKTPEYFKEVMPKLSDYAIFSQFKTGLTNSHLTIAGNPQQSYVMPEAFEMMRAGYQAEFPVDLGGMRVPFTARAGQGAKSYFFFGNSAPQAVGGTLGFDNRRIVPGESLLLVRKMRDRAETINKIDKDFTRIETELASRVPVIFESVAVFRRGAETLDVRVLADKKLDRRTYTMEFNNKKAFSTTMRFRSERFYKLASVTVNGRRVSFADKNGEYVTDGAVALAPDSRVEAVYTSDIFKLPEAAILNFAFTDAAKKTTFDVSYPAPAWQAAANRFQEYFAFCRSKKIIAGNAGDVKLIQAFLPNPGKGRIALLGADAKDIAFGISQAPAGGLRIKAATPEAAEVMLNELFAVMDKKYEYVFPFFYVMGLSGEMLNHFKMYGKSLPYTKYFEAAR